MKIVGFEVMDFMRLRQIKVLLREKGLTQFTGRNGAGKTTLLKFVEWMLAGPTTVKTNLKDSVVRRGATKAWGKLELKDKAIGHYLITRTLTTGGTMDLDIWEWRDGKPFDRVENQQTWLKTLLTGLSFDPLAFAKMKTKEQIAELKRLAHVDLDFPALAEADLEDTQARKNAKKEVEQFEVQVAEIDVVLEGLPEKKIDETAIFQKISSASEISRHKQELGATTTTLGMKALEYGRRADEVQARIKRLTEELATAKGELVEVGKQQTQIQKQHQEAEKAFQAAPDGDVTALTAELQKAQRTNRAIDTRARWEKLNKELEDKRRLVADIQARLDARDQKRAQAMADAKLPVPQLSFDETQVLYKNLPLANWGEGEQIRISTLLGIHMNPGLQAMCIQHGEALDEDGLKVIEDLALEHDFQILMARVETTGKVGIVIEDGMVAANNDRKSEVVR